MINTRDLPAMVDRSTKGVVFDVSRSTVTNFDYGSLESLKNGIVISGKYEEQLKRFKSDMKIAVFSNAYPDLTRLSKDRWDVLDLDKIPIENSPPVIFPAAKYPFQDLPSLPDISEDFDLKEFLEARVAGQSDSVTDFLCTQANLPSTSQPVPSTSGMTNNETIPDVIVGSLYCLNGKFLIIIIYIFDLYVSQIFLLI